LNSRCPVRNAGQGFLQTLDQTAPFRFAFELVNLESREGPQKSRRVFPGHAAQKQRDQPKGAARRPLQPRLSFRIILRLDSLAPTRPDEHKPNLTGCPHFESPIAHTFAGHDVAPIKPSLDSLALEPIDDGLGFFRIARAARHVNLG